MTTYEAVEAVTRALADRGIAAPPGRHLHHIAHACVDAARPAIRQQVAEEIIAKLEARRAEIAPGRPGWGYLTEAIDMAREIGGGQ